MINAISIYIAEKITCAILKCGIFSISMDTLFNISCKEQLLFVIRYVDKNSRCVQERFLAMKSTPSTSGQSLMIVFEQICQKKQSTIEDKPSRTVL